MDQIKLEPYLFFGGDCRQAMEFYKTIFGGELSLQTRGEIDAEAPADMKDKIIHARLEGEVTLMASDNMDPEALGRGKIQLSLSGTNEAKLRQWFNRLSEGGKVVSDLKKEFWGDTFGVLTDKYAVDWMVNISAHEAGSAA